MTVDEDVLMQLCGVAPQDFVTARDACVKQLKDAGHKGRAAEVKALKRPGVPLWALNQLPRRHPAQVVAWLALAARLKTAQRDALTPEGAGELKEAMRQQREMLASLVGLAEGILTEAGHAADVHGPRVREMLQSALSGDDETRHQFKKGILLGEPQAGDVSDVLSMMAASMPAKVTTEKSTAEPPPPADELSQRRDAARKHVEEQRATKEATERARLEKVSALQQQVAQAEAERAALVKMSSEKRAEADKAIAASEQAEAVARALSLQARAADAAAHQAKKAVEEVERRLRELGAEVRKV